MYETILQEGGGPCVLLAAFDVQISAGSSPAFSQGSRDWPLKDSHLPLVCPPYVGGLP